jgi:sec-independent protein translocase protein TatA
MPGTWEIIIIVALLLIIFGRGKISDLMGEVAKGIKSFKKGISEDDENKTSVDKSDDLSQKD